MSRRNSVEEPGDMIVCAKEGISEPCMYKVEDGESETVGVGG